MLESSVDTDELSDTNAPIDWLYARRLVLRSVSCSVTEFTAYSSSTFAPISCDEVNTVWNSTLRYST